MRRRRPGPGRIGLALLALAIIAPPIIRWRFQTLVDREGEVLTPVEELRIKLVTAQEELSRAKVDLAVHGIVPPSERHAVRLGDVLPLSDPSTRRSALWVVVRGPEHVSPRSVSLWASPGGGLFLVGRVARVLAGSSLVRVESLLDPAFRVCFQTRGASGVLWGTGERRDGRVVLAIHHLSEAVEIEDGEPVFTQGNDGLYPPGILIGCTARKEGQAGAPSFEVHSAIDPTHLSRILIAEDTAARKLAAHFLEEAEARRKGRSSP